MIHIQLTEHQLKILVSLLDAAVKSLGVQCIKATVEITDIIDKAVEEFKNTPQDIINSGSGTPKAE